MADQPSWHPAACLQHSQSKPSEAAGRLLWLSNREMEIGLLMLFASWLVDLSGKQCKLCIARVGAVLGGAERGLCCNLCEMIPVCAHLPALVNKPGSSHGPSWLAGWLVIIPPLSSPATTLPSYPAMPRRTPRTKKQTGAGPPGGPALLPPPSPDGPTGNPLSAMWFGAYRLTLGGA